MSIENLKRVQQIMARRGVVSTAGSPRAPVTLNRVIHTKGQAQDEGSHEGRVSQAGDEHSSHADPANPFFNDESDGESARSAPSRQKDDADGGEFDFIDGYKSQSASSSAPALSSSGAVAQSTESVQPAEVAQSAGAQAKTQAPEDYRAAPRPGVFSSRLAKVSAAIAAEPKGTPRFYEQVAKQSQEARERSQGVKEMATVRALTRLLEAVYRKPGGDAPESERIDVLRTLVVQADEVAHSVALAFGHGERPNQYVMAQAMEAVVSLVGQSWERDDTVDWGEVLVQASTDPLIVSAAETMAQAVYRRVDSKDSAKERLAISLHNAYWEVYALGENVDGVTPELASRVVRDIAGYVQAQNKFESVDLNVSWMQGAIKRITSLFCAHLRPMDAAPTEKEIKHAIQWAKDGYEGVESHANQLLEMCRVGGSRAVPIDAPSRPIG